ncbi:hypothetical protein GCM10028778_20400 [Barrientosiimonas marina]|uniref:DUF3221 domain-containing protein n=1 Tax=Lentibacillus kimchii TaxID=1542911 RepID=A0ABW2UU74_9BACI
MNSKKLKGIMPLLLLCLVLTACDELKLGDTFTLDRTAQGGMTISSKERIAEKTQALQEKGGADAVEEYLDLSEMASFSSGTVVRVTDFSDDMVQIQNTKPKANGMKIWLAKEKLKKVM